MTIIRRELKHGFLVIPNEITDDVRLSWEARGLLAYLLAKPDDWDVNVPNLMRQGGVGRDKTYRIVNELIAAGYVVRDLDRHGEGRGSKATYTVYDAIQPTARPDTEKADVVATTSGFSGPENPDAIDKELKLQIPPNPPKQGGEDLNGTREGRPATAHVNGAGTGRPARRKRRRRDEIDVIDWAARATFWAQTGGDWVLAWGPRPGEARFKGPPDLFADAPAAGGEQ